MKPSQNLVSMIDSPQSESEELAAQRCAKQGFHIWHTNWVRLAPNGTVLGLFKISFSAKLY